MFRPLNALLMSMLLFGCTRGPGGKEPNKAEKRESPAVAVPSRLPKVKLETSMGNIIVELFPKNAPRTVENFLRYVDEDRYDGVIFHLVEPGVKIETGAYDSDMSLRPMLPPIPSESDNALQNWRGMLAMGRARSSPDGAKGHFFINLKDNPEFDSDRSEKRIGYTVFGKVVEGMDVADMIGEAATGKRGIHEKVPIEDVILISAQRIEEGKKDED